MKRSNKTNPATAKRDRQIVEMRLAGATMTQIAEKFDISAAYVQKICSKVAHEHGVCAIEKMGEYKAMQVARLERLRVAWWQQALTGNPDAATVVLKCLAQMAKIEGTDSPKPMDPRNLTAETIRAELIAALKG